MNGTWLLRAVLDIGRDALLGTLLGIAGMGYGFYLYRKGRVFRRMYFAHAGLQVVGVLGLATSKDIAIQYRGETVPQVTLTRVAIWNGGKDTILAAHLVDSNPIAIGLQDGGILEAKILRVTRADTGCTIDTKPGYDQCYVSFKFLDPDDGLIVELLHTSAFPHARVAGTVIGMKEGIQSGGRNVELLSLNRYEKRSVAASINDFLTQFLFPYGMLSVAAYFLVKSLFFPKGLDAGVDQPINWSGVVLVAPFIVAMGWVLFGTKRAPIPTALLAARGNSAKNSSGPAI